MGRGIKYKILSYKYSALISVSADKNKLCYNVNI